MLVNIALKQIGSKKPAITQIPFEYATPPTTVKDLITQTVEICVRDYNERVRQGDARIKPLTKQQITDMAEVGKIAFGINYGNKEQSPTSAVENALQSFEDGLYRVFINDEEMENLSAPIQLHENDTLTFIRLTMLSGRMW